MRARIRSLVRGEAPWPLFLWGPPGAGKTCAALCLLDLAGGEYATLPGLCEHLIAAQHGRASYDFGAESRTLWPERIWKMVEKCTTLVVDEIGTRPTFASDERNRPSPFQYETLKKCLDLRYGRPSLFLSNLGLEALGRLYDDRVASRLAAGTIVMLDGPDRRLPEEPRA